MREREKKELKIKKERKKKAGERMGKQTTHLNPILKGEKL